jgi:hypothetical protein
VTEATTFNDRSANVLLKAAASGLLTGVLTPLLPPLIDKIGGSPGDFRLALVAFPFAILVLVLVRRCSQSMVGGADRGHCHHDRFRGRGERRGLD